MPLIPKVHTVTVHTSNVINWSNMKKKPLSTTTAELLDYSKALCKCWKKAQDENALQYVDAVEIECKAHKDIISDEERDEIRVTAKLWLCTWNEKVFIEAFQKALQCVNVTDIDTLLISFPTCLPPPIQNDSHTAQVTDPYIAAVLNIWREVEKFSADNLALRIGVCDFPIERLRILHDVAEVKPMINQMYVYDSCKISQELADFAQERHIQLLVHHDDPDILPSSEIQSIFSEVFSPSDGRDWEPMWVLCYHSLYKMRGIIRAKGYAYKLHRDLGSKQIPL